MSQADLMVRNVNLPDGRTGVDVAVRAGRIVEIGPALPGQAQIIVEGGGQLLSAPFVDPHFHMDSTLSYGMPRINQSGTLLEGIALWSELKPLLSA